MRKFVVSAPARKPWRRCLAVGAGLLLAACNNTYGPPPTDGTPRNAGQQRYLDNQRYQETIDQGQSV